MIHTGDTAGIDMESAILIKMSAGDAADDSQDRKVVTHHDDGFSGLVTPRDTMQTLPSSLRDIDEPFAAGNLNLRRLGPPPADEAGVVLFDLRESQAFERAVIELAYACFNGHRQIVFLADEPRGVARAF